MNRTNAIDYDLPSIRHPAAWEISGQRRRPYSATGLTPRDLRGYGLGTGHPSHHHRHHANARARDELLYPHTDSRHQLIEMEDLLEQYREELERKDREILRLTNIETPRQQVNGRVDPQYGVDYMAPAVGNGAEVASLQVRVTSLEAKLFEAERAIDERDQTIRNMTASMDVQREADARNQALIQSMRQKLAQYEASYGSIESAADRSELTIVTLQQQSREAHERIVDLETKLKTLSEERDRAEQRALSAELKLSEMLTQIGSILLVDSVAVQTTEKTISAIRELVHENSMLRGKVSTVKDQSKNMEMDAQIHRETVSRLNAQIDRLNKSASTTAIDMDNLRLERDASLTKQRELEREVELLKERLDASQLGWSDARRQLQDERLDTFDERRHRPGRRGSLEERPVYSDERRDANSTHLLLLDLAQLLSDGRLLIEPNEQKIRERICDLLRALRDKNAHIDMLEQKVADLQCELDVSQDRNHNRSRPDIDHVENRLKRAEIELAKYERVKEALHTEKAKFARFVDDVIQILRIEAEVLHLSKEALPDVLLRRLEKVVRNEVLTRSKEPADHADCRLHIHGLQRKLKHLKEQLNSKELELDVLNKKLTGLEDRVAAGERNDREREEEFAKNRRLVKLVEKYKRELDEAHREIRELKARVVHCAEIQSRTTEKERQIEKLEGKVGQLEHVRHQQAMKITDLESEMTAHAEHFNQQDEAVATRIAILSDEVRTLRKALEETSRRERQLQDLRRVIARMLGIDIVAIPVPDYEIVSRLEKLILANQTNPAIPAASWSLSDIIDDMSDDFRSGYANAGYVLAPRRQRARSPVRSSRSQSPSRRIDPKVY